MSILLSGTTIPAFSAVRGGIEYSIPIDYSKVNEVELEAKAHKYFFLAEKYQDGIINDDITDALTLYNILQHVNPNKIEYAVKSGILYDKIGKDRQAKGCFSRAISINSQNPISYFYFGEYYYKHQSYRKALKYYSEAYKLGYNKNYNLLYKMGDIYEKFGDTRSALKYLQEAQKQSSNPELENKIRRIEANNAINHEYYSDTRIRIPSTQ